MTGLQSERKSIKVTLKGGKTPVTATDSGQEELIGKSLGIGLGKAFETVCYKMYRKMF